MNESDANKRPSFSAPKTSPEITGPCCSENLTFAFLKTLNEGQYLVSNCYDLLDDGRYEPAFREHVAVLPNRRAQWDRIKRAHANGRLCWVFRTEADYLAWQQNHPASETKPPA